MDQLTIKCVVVYKYYSCRECGFTVEQRDRSIYDGNMVFVCNTGWYAKENTPKIICECLLTESFYGNKETYRYIEMGLTVQTLTEKGLITNEEHPGRDNHKYIYGRTCSDCSDRIVIMVIHKKDHNNSETVSYIEQFLNSFEIVCPECTDNRNIPKPAIPR